MARNMFLSPEKLTPTYLCALSTWDFPSLLGEFVQGKANRRNASPSPATIRKLRNNPEAKEFLEFLE
ncbi:hypothetical protein Golax_023743, partial [Gossypium laxum]|nr:hypothetical protein [Gossypium laxum]